MKSTCFNFKALQLQDRSTPYFSALHHMALYFINFFLLLSSIRGTSKEKLKLSVSVSKLGATVAAGAAQ